MAGGIDDRSYMYGGVQMEGWRDGGIDVRGMEGWTEGWMSMTGGIDDRSYMDGGVQRWRDGEMEGER